MILYACFLGVIGNIFNITTVGKMLQVVLLSPVVVLAVIGVINCIVDIVRIVLDDGEF